MYLTFIWVEGWRVPFHQLGIHTQYNSECLCSHDICEVVGVKGYQNDRQKPQFPVLYVKILYGTEIRINMDEAVG